MNAHPDFLTVLDHSADRTWRLANLYYITDKEGRKVRFEPNWAQQALLEDRHDLNLILKARQLGFTTFIQLLMLDECLFHPNVRAGTIAHTLDDAVVIFRDKVKFPYDNLPYGLRAAIPSTKDSATELLLANNSSVRVGTSLRSGTLQILHISEYGKVCAKFPEKAREIRTGALNTVQAGQLVFIESTAEGQEGHFYELCEMAQTKARLDQHLTSLDFKFLFFPWWKSPEYRIDPHDVLIEAGFSEYFDRLRLEHSIDLEPAQRAWYVKKAETQQEDMKREYPSTPEEAFAASVEGAYYAKELARAEIEKRICPLIYSSDFGPVETAWDIGHHDPTAIWFFQRFKNWCLFIDYYENSEEGLDHYVEVMKAKGYDYGTAWFPHDGRNTEWGSGKTRVEFAIAAGLGPRLIADHQLYDGIHAARQHLAISLIDPEKCADGLKALRAYRKEWDEERAAWKDKPRHDWSSHGADAFRAAAFGFKIEPPPVKPKPKRPDELQYTARPDGSVTGNMTIPEIVAAKKRKRENA